MNKELIKKYALNINAEQVISYAAKENIEVSLDEANIFVSVVKDNIDEILEGHALEILSSIKDDISTSSYDKLLELYDKYKGFIE